MASVTRYCTCKDPDTGKIRESCPELKRSDKHGKWQYRGRVPTGKGTKPIRRRGLRTRKEALALGDQVRSLLALARGDRRGEERIGDLIRDRLGRREGLPSVDDIRRRLGIGLALDAPDETVETYLRRWLRGKRSLRASASRDYGQHIDHWLAPHLGHLPMDGFGRLNADHIADLFDLIEEFNGEIRAAAAEGRRPHLPRDARARSRVVGIARQRRIFATLRNALNDAVRRRLVDVNPCDFVEMPEEVNTPARTWSPDQVGLFLEATQEDRLHTLYRMILLHGPRRGEAVGARRSDYDKRTRSLTMLRPLLQLGGQITEGRPKTRAGERVLYLDEGTAQLVQRDIVARSKERLSWGEAYDDHDLVWCQEDGRPYYPDTVSRRFKALATAAGLPPIKLHEGRHTAASLRLEAGVDEKVVAEQIGHSTPAITRKLYQHVRRAQLDGATEKVLELLPPQVRGGERAAEGNVSNPCPTERVPSPRRVRHGREGKRNSR